jgi:hypothetical protein
VAARSAAARLLGLPVRIPPGHGCLSLVIVVFCRYRSLRRTDSSSRELLPSVCVCVCVSLSVIKWNNNLYTYNV